MHPHEARTEALKRFGGIEQIKEECRDAWGIRMMNDFIRDLRLGFRQVNSHKRYALVVVLTLSLCIGANTAIFSMLNTALLKSYPYPEAGKLVRVVTDLNDQGHHRTIEANSLPSYFRYQEVESIAELGFYQGSSNIITLKETAEYVNGVQVSPSFFRVLNIQPLHGRWFYDEEGVDGQHLVIILSYTIWQSVYNGDTNIIGKNIQLDDENFKIVGIMPEGFYFISKDVRFWRPYPITTNVKSASPWDWEHLNFFARLKPEVTIEQAQSELDTVATRMVEDYPEHRSYVEATGWRPHLVNYHEHRVGNAKTVLYMLQGSAWIVLLIGCVNVANLSLTRAITRTRELALRIMLGARIGRIVRMLLTESFLYGLMGCVLGLILAFLGIELISTFGLYSYPRDESLSLDTTVLLYTVTISFLCSFIVGLLPLLSIMKADLVSGSQSGDRTTTVGLGAQRIRSFLIIAQISLTFILLICSALLIKSLTELLKVDPGFNPKRVLTARIKASDRFETKQIKQYFSGLLERINQVPGVIAAGTNVTSPFLKAGWYNSYHIETYDYQPGEVNQNFATSVVDGRYFDALGLNIVMGRSFELTDLSANAHPVVVVDKNFADLYFPHGDVIGKRLTRDVGPGSTTSDNPTWFSIVGVVGNVKQNNLSESEENPKPRIYNLAREGYPRYQQLIIRFADTDDVGNPQSEEAMIESVKVAIREFNPNIPPYDFQMLESRIDSTLNQRRASIRILLAFAGLAIILSAVGLYGVISYIVEQRRKEIGIRLAMGAQRKTVMQMIFNQGIRLTILGLLIGIFGVAAASQLIRNQLFEVESVDPLIYALVAVQLAIVSFFACYLPSRKVLRVDPMTVLRYE